MDSGLGAAKNVAEKQPEVWRELGYLEKACAQLREAIETVEARFASALARIPGGSTCEKEEKPGYACDLAAHIATHRNCVEDAVRHLDEIRKRCEL